jgi:hypothetical protein
MPQLELKKYLFKKLRKSHGEVEWRDGFLYAKGEFPVLLVAHMDTVHKETVKEVICSDGKINSPQGIGGDDRCGIYMILEIVKRYNCSVLFCEDEETGGRGATKFTKSDCSMDVNANYIVELDRRGSTDAVFYECDNPEFTDFICKEYFKEAYGTFSDISVVAPHLGLAAVNLSSGYYNAHTTSEYVVEEDIDNIVIEVFGLLDRTDETKFEYIEEKHIYSKWLTPKFTPIYTMEIYEFEYVDEDGKTDYAYIEGDSEDEALFEFLLEHGNIPYRNIINVTNYGDVEAWGM